MREIGALEAKNKLSALLDQVEHGAEIVITRHWKAVAKLVPAELGFDRKRQSAPPPVYAKPAREPHSAASRSKTSSMKAVREFRRR
jgi:prevent-host-death family protein